MKEIKYQDIKKSEEIKAYLSRGNQSLAFQGYTDHSVNHAMIVAERAGKILQILEYDKRQVELAKIAGFMHDIGNCINRVDHAQHGAVLACSILKDMGMGFEEIALIMNAIGEHDETTGHATNPVSAAVILADKTDVRRNRVQEKISENFDQHDKVNYAVTDAALNVHPKKRTVRFSIQLDESICSMMDYFEIFLERMLMCKRAAEVLELKFKMTANGNKIC